MQRIVKAQSFTANSQNMDLDVTDIGQVAFSIKGTYALTVTFYVSDDGGTTYFPLLMMPANAAVGVLTHSAANATQMYKADVAPYTHLRVATTAYTSGTGVARMSGVPLQN